MRRAWMFGLAALMVWAAPAARPHALDPESIDRYVEITFTPTKLIFIYQIMLGLNPTERAAAKLDPDRDGVITDAERDAYVKEEAASFSARQYVKLGDHLLPLEFQMGDAYSSFGHNAITVIKLDLAYTCALPPDLPRSATVPFEFTDYWMEPILGWKQMQVKTAPGARYEGHIPYRDFEPFDWEILAEKGFFPATDNISGQAWFDESGHAAEVVLPERTAPTDIVEESYDGLVFSLLGAFGLIAAGIVWLKRRR